MGPLNVLKMVNERLPSMMKDITLPKEVLLRVIAPFVAPRAESPQTQSASGLTVNTPPPAPKKQFAPHGTANTCLCAPARAGEFAEHDASSVDENDRKKTHE